MTRNRRVWALVSEKEEDLIREAAGLDERTISAYVRTVLMKETRRRLKVNKEDPSAIVKEALDETDGPY